MGDISSPPYSPPSSGNNVDTLPPDVNDLRGVVAELIVTLANRRDDRDGGVSTRPEVIRDLNAFLFKNIPYGNVVASNLSQGLIEVEDMDDFDEYGPTNPQLPYWYFGSKAYRITRAARIHYTYAYPIAGQPPATGSLFFGYQPNGALEVRAQAHANGQIGANGASPARVLATVGTKRDAATPAQLKELVRGFLGGAKPTLSNTQFAGEIKDFDEFVVSVLLKGKPSPGSFADRQTNEMRRWLNFESAVDYCGIAQDNDPSKPFPYNLSELVAANKLDQLIPWHFGGRAYRVTKAIRLNYTSLGPANQDAGEPLSGTLLIGYQGPHPY